MANTNLFDNTTITLKNGAKEVVQNYFVFEGKGSFIDLTDRMNTLLTTNRGLVEDELTKALAELLENKDNGIGFVPTIRNVLAVVFANGEAFLRLMDDVHTKAWEQRDSKIRKGVIFDKQIANASSGHKSSGDDKNQPVYPWPQVIKETLGDDKQEKFEIVYPGDKSISTMTKAYIPEIWPEVEFVEEFIKGYTDREPKTPDYGDETNVVTRPNRLSLNALDFPVSNEVFQNKEEIKILL